MSQNVQIAIDGPAASGKSTVARRLAEKLGASYISTGELYRALTWIAMSRGIDAEHHPEQVIPLLDDVCMEFRKSDTACATLYVDGQPISQSILRAPEVTANASYVARIPEVREWLLDRQRACTQLGIIVMEGRDIGTVVFPQAQFKFFVSASPEERARRRLAQEGESSHGATLRSVAKDIARRDHIDSSRAAAPLHPAPDALRVDTTQLGIDEVVETLMRHIQMEKPR